MKWGLLWHQWEEVVAERCMWVAYVSVCGSYCFVGQVVLPDGSLVVGQGCNLPPLLCHVTSGQLHKNWRIANWHGVPWLRKVTQTVLVLRRLILQGYLRLHVIPAMRQLIRSGLLLAL
jgi:hypothetical protein